MDDLFNNFHFDEADLRAAEDAVVPLSIAEVVKQKFTGTASAHVNDDHGGFSPEQRTWILNNMFRKDAAVNKYFCKCSSFGYALVNSPGTACAKQQQRSSQVQAHSC